MWAAGATLLLLAGPARAQFSGSSGGSSGGGGGGGGGSFGSGSSSSGGGSSGGAGSSTAPSSFTGSTFGSRLGGSGSGRGTSTYGSTGIMGRYLANPIAIGVPTSISAGNTTSKPLWYSSALPFGTATYVTTGTGQLGGGSQFGSTGTGFGGLGGSAALTTTGRAFPGASSIGVRRAPAYTTTLGFDFTPRTPDLVRTDLQAVLARSSRLPSSQNIQVVMDGNEVVLRGKVATAGERRLAEGLVRLTPGVRSVRNEIEAPADPKRDAP